MLGMPSNGAIKAGLLKMCMQKVLIFQKKNLFNSWIRTRDLLNASQLYCQLGYRCCCDFSGMLLSIFFFNLLQSTN